MLLPVVIGQHTTVIATHLRWTTDHDTPDPRQPTRPSTYLILASDRRWPVTMQQPDLLGDTMPSNVIIACAALVILALLAFGPRYFD